LWKKLRLRLGRFSYVDGGVRKLGLGVAGTGGGISAGIFRYIGIFPLVYMVSVVYIHLCIYPVFFLIFLIFIFLIIILLIPIFIFFLPYPYLPYLYLLIFLIVIFLIFFLILIFIFFSSLSLL
jgi:hypothetical protein